MSDCGYTYRLCSQHQSKRNTHTHTHMLTHTHTHTHTHWHTHTHTHMGHAVDIWGVIQLCFGWATPSRYQIYQITPDVLLSLALPNGPFLSHHCWLSHIFIPSVLTGVYIALNFRVCVCVCVVCVCVNMWVWVCVCEREREREREREKCSQGGSEIIMDDSYLSLSLKL